MTTTIAREMTVFRPADEFGSVLGSRFLAVDLRERIEAILDSHGSIVIDFDGVEAVSPSFADELFAKLPRDAIDDNVIRFENVGSELRVLARYVMAGRGSGHAASR